LILLYSTVVLLGTTEAAFEYKKHIFPSLPGATYFTFGPPFSYTLCCERIPNYLESTSGNMGFPQYNFQISSSAIWQTKGSTLPPRPPPPPHTHALILLPLYRLLTAVTQRFVGLITGLVEASLVSFYQYVVDPAPPDSWPVRLFERLATGPIKYPPRPNPFCPLHSTQMQAGKA